MSTLKTLFRTFLIETAIDKFLENVWYNLIAYPKIKDYPNTPEGLIQAVRDGAMRERFGLTVTEADIRASIIVWGYARTVSSLMDLISKNRYHP